MTKHFEFIPEDQIDIVGRNQINIVGRTLTRIRATIDLPHHRIKAGHIGGYIEHESNLSDAAWVDGNARVYENAIVRGHAYIGGSARVYENAIVCDDAIIRDSARIAGSVCISGNAYIDGNALIGGRAKVEDFARVGGNAVVNCDSRIFEHAIVSGYSNIFSRAQIYGHATVNFADVGGSAHVCGYAEVSGCADFTNSALIRESGDYLVMGPAISSGRFTTAYRTADGSIEVSTGCFNGSISKFIEAINETHANDECCKRQYMSFVRMIESAFVRRVEKYNECRTFTHEEALAAIRAYYGVHTDDIVIDEPTSDMPTLFEFNLNVPDLVADKLTTLRNRVVNALKTK